MKIRDVENLLVSAFEGGSNYWYQIEETKAPKKYAFRTSAKRIFPHVDYPLNEGGSLVISSLEGDDFAFKKRWTLNLEAIRNGLKVMAEKYPVHFADVLKEDADSITGDVFLQCCLFGEVRYS